VFQFHECGGPKELDRIESDVREIFEVIGAAVLVQSLSPYNYNYPVF